MKKLIDLNPETYKKIKTESVLKGVSINQIIKKHLTHFFQTELKNDFFKQIKS